MQPVFKNIIADVMKTVPPGTKAADPNTITLPVGGNPIIDLDAQFAAMLQAQFENGKGWNNPENSCAILTFYFRGQRSR